jgi:uncharacterized protein (DUF342 family)/pSer/pThr/pTyr-binding forkhead associated (FHA) protein
MAVDSKTARKRDALYEKESWRRLVKLCKKILITSGPDRNTFHDLAVAHMRLAEVDDALDSAVKVLLEDYGSGSLETLSRRIHDTFFASPAKGENARRNRHFEVIAEVLLAQEDDARAEQVLSALRQAHYPSPDGLYLLADLYLKQVRAEDAASLLVSLPGEFGERWELLAEYTRNLLNDALDAFDFAHHFTEKLASDALENTVGAFSRKLRQRDRNERNLTFLLFAALALGDLVEAEKLYDELAGINLMTAERFSNMLPSIEGPAGKVAVPLKTTPAKAELEEMALVYGFRGEAFVHHVKDTVTRIGRRRDNDLMVLAAGVSRQHCMIEEKEGEYTLIDLESRNGTRFQGKLIDRAQIFPGDVFIIGEVIFFFVPKTRADTYKKRLLTVPPRFARALSEPHGADAPVTETGEFKIEDIPTTEESETIGIEIRSPAATDEEKKKEPEEKEKAKAEIEPEEKKEPEPEESAGILEEEDEKEFDSAKTDEIKLKPDFVIDEIGPTSLVSEMEGDGWTISIAISEDSMNVYLSINVEEKGVNVPLEAIRHLLAREEIALEPEIEVMEEALKWVSGTGIDMTWAHIISGVEPEHGQDGKMEWVVEPVDQLAREVAAEVKAGQTVAKVAPPTPGKPGVNIFGQAVPARVGRQMEYTLSDSLATTDAGREVYTLRGGRLILALNEIVIESEGDDALAAGKITFAEEVEVEQDVSGDIRVSAEKGITVGGSIEKAQIESGEHIDIKGGVSGQKQGWLKAETRIMTEFLHGVTARAISDIVVSSEIINSQVLAFDKIELLAGRVLGGELNAMNRIVVPVAGGRMGVRTKLTVGRGGPLEAMFAEMKDQINAARNRIVKLSREITAFEAQKRKRGELTGREEELLTEYKATVDSARLEREALDAERRKLERLLRDSRGGEIIITQRAYPGVILRIGTLSTEIMREVAGPVAVIADRRLKKLVIEPMK